jgi:hypothetical protein
VEVPNLYRQAERSRRRRQKIYKGKMMVEWAEVNKDGNLVIDWNEVFENSQEYDLGRRTFDSALGKLIAMVQKTSFEKGFLAGIDAKHPEQRLLGYTGGNA